MAFLYLAKVLYIYIKDRSRLVKVVMNSTSIYLSHVQWKRWNALFVPEEIIRINFGLHMHQPVEVILEVLSTKNTRIHKTCVRIEVQFVSIQSFRVKPNSGKLRCII